MGFDRRLIAVAPGARRPVAEGEFADALLVVVCGEIEVECRAGGRARFLPGDVLWLAGLPVSCLRNPGPDRAEVVRVRRSGDEFRGAPPSEEVPCQRSGRSE